MPLRAWDSSFFAAYRNLKYASWEQTVKVVWGHLSSSLLAEVAERTVGAQWRTIFKVTQLDEGGKYQVGYNKSEILGVLWGLLLFLQEIVMNLDQLNATIRSSPYFAEIAVNPSCNFTRVKLVEVEYGSGGGLLAVFLQNLETRIIFRYQQECMDDHGTWLWRVTYKDQFHQDWRPSEDHPYFRIRCPELDSINISEMRSRVR